MDVMVIMDKLLLIVCSVSYWLEGIAYCSTQGMVYMMVRRVRILYPLRDKSEGTFDMYTCTGGGRERDDTCDHGSFRKPPRVNETSCDLSLNVKVMGK